MPPRTILLINKFYHDIGPAGGVGRYLLQEEQHLLEQGWNVVPFAMKDADARPSQWDRFFVGGHDYSEPAWSPGAPAAALSLIWNREAARNLERLITATRPAVAHIHNIYHHLSPSILPVLARHRIPVVQTLHDLRLLCPAIHMLRQGEICERCRGGRFIEAVRGRCVKGSLSASLLAAIETRHQTSRRLYTRNVSRFLCPSSFLAGKYAEWGFPAERLTHLPNFVDVEAWRPDPAPENDGVLYFGRLSREKGLHTLLRAQARIERGEAGARTMPLRIAGGGPAEDELRSLAGELELEQVEFLGNLSSADLGRELARVKCTVLPSECYENGPLSLLESMAAGVPVVGADIGGIPEHIADGVDGLLFRPGDAADLAAALLRAVDLGPAAGQAARAKAENLYSLPVHMARLLAVLRDPSAEPCIS